MLALLFPAIAFHEVIHFGFVWDDILLFVFSPDLRTGSITWDKLSAPILPGSSYFRPLVLLIFAIDFHWLGVSTQLEHSINFAIFLLNCILVYYIGTETFLRSGLTRPQWRAIAATVLYGTHPALIESVAWISGRFDLLATFFILLALALDLKLVRPWSRALSIGLCFGLALASKELGVVLPFLLLLQHAILTRQQSRSTADFVVRELRLQWRLVLSGTVVSLIYLALRYQAMPRMVQENPETARALSNAGEHLSLIFNACFFYVREIFQPFTNINPLHPFDLADLLTLRSCAKAAFAVLLIALIIRMALQRRLPGLLAVCGMLCLLPVIHIIPLTIANNIGHDRFLALPLAFFALSVAAVRIPTSDSFRPRAATLTVTVAFASWLALALGCLGATLPAWKSDLSLWASVYARDPDSDSGTANFLNAALRSHRLDLMPPVFRKLQGQGPLDARFQLIYGDYLARTGEPQEGEAYIRGALLAYPPLHTMTAEQRWPWRNWLLTSRNVMAYSYYALANAQLIQGNYGGAYKSVEAALWYNAFIPPVRLMKALALYGMNKPETADIAYQQALAVSLPSDIGAAARVRQELFRKLCVEEAPSHQEVCATLPHR